MWVQRSAYEWNRLQGDAAAEQDGQQTELRQVRQQIERLVDAIVGGTPAAAVRERLTVLEQRRLDLEAALASATAPAPRLHPNLASVYRQKVAELTRVLETEDAAEARDLVRSLVETITLVPAGGRLQIEVRGELAAILQLADQAKGNRHPQGGGIAAGQVLAEQIKMVAGAGFEPAAFRL